MCYACPAGKTRSSGDDTRSNTNNTACAATLCSANKFVSSGHASMDDPSGDATACDDLLCPENHHIDSGTCTTCADGRYNAANNGTGTCADVLCLAGE